MKEIDLNEAENKGLVALTKVLVPGTIITSAEKLKFLGNEEFPDATHYSFLGTSSKMKEIKTPRKLKPFGITTYKKQKRIEDLSTYILWSDNQKVYERFNLNPSKPEKETNNISN
ncbi:MAG: hypothetical protein ABIE36_00745 [Candidatus Diapherotrites archaeon]